MSEKAVENTPGAPPSGDQHLLYFKLSTSIFFVILLCFFVIRPAWIASGSPKPSLPAANSSIILDNGPETDGVISYWITLKVEAPGSTSDSRLEATMRLAAHEDEEGNPGAFDRGLRDRKFALIVRGNLGQHVGRCDDPEIEQGKFEFGDLTPEQRTSAQFAVQRIEGSRAGPNKKDGKVSWAEAAKIASEETYSAIQLTSSRAQDSHEWFVKFECPIRTEAFWTRTEEGWSLRGPRLFGAFSFRDWNLDESYTDLELSVAPLRSILFSRSVAEPKVHEDGSLSWRSYQYGRSGAIQSGKALADRPSVSAIFIDSELDANKRGLIFLGGVAAGLAATLLAGAANTVVDLVWVRVSRRSNRNRAQ